MISERLSKRVHRWTNRLLTCVGFLTLVGLGLFAYNGHDSSSVSHLVRRSALQYLPSIIHVETGYIIDNSNENEKLYFEDLKEKKDFVKYQYPSEKFVPLNELVTVLLNGMRFYHQGEEMLPVNDTDSSGHRKADTRGASDTLRCEGRNDYKAYKREHTSRALPSKPDQTQDDAVPTDDDFDINIPDIFRTGNDGTKKEKSSGGAGKFKPDDSVPVDDNQSDDLNPQSARTAFDKDLAAEFLSFFDSLDDAQSPTNDAMVNDVVANTTAAPTTTSVDQRNHRIGCCNGVPYNQNKRCCCRRIAFDKDKKFCCAIDGCAKFKVFDRSNPKNIDLCLSLEGLVVQEYGYTGEHVALGEPDLTRKSATRPQ